MSIIDSSLDLERQEIDRFRDALGNCLGLRFEDAKSDFLAHVLDRRARVTRRTSSEYVDYLAARRPLVELGALAQELTVPETYFFRNIEQFHALAERVIPERMRDRSADRRLRILSAGCASGEEAYTIAILLRDVLEPGWKTSIVGVDLSPSVLQKAQRGRFTTWSLRETPRPMQERWFRREGLDVVLDDEIKAMVRFEQHNLADDDWALWDQGPFDVIFCRNVMMYFSPDSARALVGRISRSLASGGFLFLGHAETLRGLTDDFQLCHTHGTFYYRLNFDGGSPELLACLPAPAREASFTEPTHAWVEAIQSASKRVQALVASMQPGNRARCAPDVSPHVGVAPSAADAIERMRDDQFLEALAILQPLSRRGVDDPEILMIQAAAAVQAGLLDAAEGFCERLLRVNAFSATAHYTMALCREGAGDVEAALKHDQHAIALDPSFAMPRLHRGLLARSIPDLDLMRSDLTAAVDLLRSEDTSRIVLFGAGFNRAALITICQTHLNDKGSS